MKRPLFVFAGQSNMMGAATREASEQIFYKRSFEYLHKPRRFGENKGIFKDFAFPVGEFAYKDLDKAYGNRASADSKSELNNYSANTLFCPSMSNINSENDKTTYPFSYFNEQNNRMAVALPPYIVTGLEDKGYSVAYTHIAKGGVPIKYYLEGEATDYFYQKTAHFFAECEEKFAGDDMSERVLVWLQGESDAKNGFEYYLSALQTFWKNAKKAGFTKFLIIRVGFFGSEKIVDVIKAQEEFCNTTDDAYIVTRVGSFLEWYGQKEGFLKKSETDEFTFCRDSFYGFANQHINEKGFKVIAKYAVSNIIRILFENKPPILEEEKIIALK